jgi:hypothetical protein
MQAPARAMRPMPADSGPDYVGPMSDGPQLLRQARMAMFKTIPPRRPRVEAIAIFPGGRFTPYLNRFPMTAPAATTWFRAHLGGNHNVH